MNIPVSFVYEDIDLALENNNGNLHIELVGKNNKLSFILNPMQARTFAENIFNAAVCLPILSKNSIMNGSIETSFKNIDTVSTRKIYRNQPESILFIQYNCNKYRLLYSKYINNVFLIYSICIYYIL